MDSSQRLKIINEEQSRLRARERIEQKLLQQTTHHSTSSERLSGEMCLQRFLNNRIENESCGNTRQRIVGWILIYPTEPEIYKNNRERINRIEEDFCSLEIDLNDLSLSNSETLKNSLILLKILESGYTPIQTYEYSKLYYYLLNDIVLGKADYLKDEIYFNLFDKIIEGKNQNLQNKINFVKSTIQKMKNGEILEQQELQIIKYILIA